MPRIYPIELKTIDGIKSVGQLVFAPEAQLSSQSSMAFQYDENWLRHGFALGADLPLVPEVQYPVSDAREVDPVLLSRAGSFGFVCDHAPGSWVMRLLSEAKIKGLKTAFDGSDITQGQLWASAGSRNSRFSALALPLRTIEAHCENPVSFDLRKSREALKSGRELAAAMNDFASGRTLSTEKDVEMLLASTLDLGGKTIKALVRLGPLPQDERVFRPNRAQEPFNRAVWTAVSAELARRCGLQVLEGSLLGEMGYLEKRFDRTDDGTPCYCASAATLVRRKRTSRANPIAAPAGYLDVADFLNTEGAQPAQDLRELFGRLLFHALTGSCHDALDDIWFVREPLGWRLLPMSVPCAEPVPAAGGRLLSTPLCGSLRNADPVEACALSRYFGLRPAQAKALRLEFLKVLSQWRSTAEDFGADFFETKQMKGAFGSA